MIKIKNGHVYSSDGKIVRRKSNGACGRNHGALPADKVADFEELDELPHYTEAEYNAKVAELIHRRYDRDAETGLINNMLDGDSVSDEHRQEYAAYQAYRAECKAQAKADLEAAWQEAHAPAPDPAEMEEATGEDAGAVNEDSIEE